MAMIDWVDRRLHNWARCGSVGLSGGLGYASVNLMTVGGTGGRPAEAVIPTNAVEAAETDEALKQLPRELYQTVQAYYKRTANRRELAAMLGCATATIDTRLSSAHRKLADIFNAKADDNRRTQEALQQATAQARAQHPRAAELAACQAALDAKRKRVRRKT